MFELKLVALDREDLKVIAAHLQDAVLKVGDIAYLASEQRFAALMNRFNWAGALASSNGGDGAVTRHRTALRIERVLRAQTQKLDLKQKDRVLSLLTIQYEQFNEDDPGGYITLVFSGESSIRFEVEYIEIELRDLGGVWAASSKPRHTADVEDE